MLFASFLSSLLCAFLSFLCSRRCSRSYVVSTCLRKLLNIFSGGSSQYLRISFSPVLSTSSALFCLNLSCAERACSLSYRLMVVWPSFWICFKIETINDLFRVLVTSCSLIYWTCSEFFFALLAETLTSRFFWALASLPGAGRANTFCFGEILLSSLLCALWRFSLCFVAIKY